MCLIPKVSQVKKGVLRFECIETYPIKVRNHMAKQSKHRMCLAVGHDITSAECGENRNSRYTCPDDCAFNPLASANYLSYLEQETRMYEQCMLWLKSHAENQADFRSCMQKVLECENPANVSIGLVHQMFIKREASGQTAADRWIRAENSAMSNDKRVLVRGMQQVHVMLLEARRVLDHQRTELVDTLTPGQKPVVIVDRALASSAVRFGTYLSVGYPLTHHWRLCGGAISIPTLGQCEPLEVVTSIVRHLGGPADTEAMKPWITQHFMKFEAALSATFYARRQKMFASMDAKFGKAAYNLQAPLDHCRSALDKIPGLLSEPLSHADRDEGIFEARVWIDDENKQNQFKASISVLGRILLSRTQVRLEATGAGRLALLRKQFESHMGYLVSFAWERFEDAGAQMQLNDPSFDPALVPPRLLENIEQLLFTTSLVRSSSPEIGDKAKFKEGFRANQEREFLDEKIPALDNRTPREAARDSALRPKLVSLMKARIQAIDEENMHHGSNLDINGLLRELGLDEIILDPPPPRKRVNPPKAR